MGYHIEREIFVLGAGVNGKSFADLLLLQDECETFGFIDDAYSEALDVWGLLGAILTDGCVVMGMRRLALK